MASNSVCTDADAANVSFQDDNAMSNSNAMRKDDGLTQPVSLEKSGSTDNNAMRNSNALSNSTLGKLRIINCVYCHKEFERKTTWQKYCSSLCKIKAYELRTGKVWKIKSKTGVQ